MAERASQSPYKLTNPAFCRPTWLPLLLVFYVGFDPTRPVRLAARLTGYFRKKKAPASRKQRNPYPPDASPSAHHVNLRKSRIGVGLELVTCGPIKQTSQLVSLAVVPLSWGGRMPARTYVSVEATAEGATCHRPCPTFVRVSLSACFRLSMIAGFVRLMRCYREAYNLLGG